MGSVVTRGVCRGVGAGVCAWPFRFLLKEKKKREREGAGKTGCQTTRCVNKLQSRGFSSLFPTEISRLGVECSAERVIIGFPESRDSYESLSLKCASKGDTN